MSAGLKITKGGKVLFAIDDHTGLVQGRMAVAGPATVPFAIPAAMDFWYYIESFDPAPPAMVQATLPKLVYDRPNQRILVSYWGIDATVSYGAL